MEWNTFEMPASSASLRALYEASFLSRFRGDERQHETQAKVLSLIGNEVAALCERRQAHGDTFSCVSFHGKSTTTTTTTTRWDDENFGRLYTSRVNETTEKPKRQAPHQEKEEEKSMQQKFKNIWEVADGEALAPAMMVIGARLEWGRPFKADLLAAYGPQSGPPAPGGEEGLNTGMKLVISRCLRNQGNPFPQRKKCNFGVVSSVGADVPQNLVARSSQEYNDCGLRNSAGS
ncbi:hypothetical protein APICC_05544 [Apis cerana cerana]|uniref:Uncharacterized protein n=1 Tax=Apis cerana cerana TaxID=94128 RepID=A0A2A3ELX2_APICC|nr:hypothetical protein APICC_05544 [Apis cerana cerana]